MTFSGAGAKENSGSVISFSMNSMGRLVRSMRAKICAASLARWERGSDQ